MAIYILENNPIQSAFLKKIIQKRIAGTNDYIYLYTNSDRFYKKICLTNEINLYLHDRDDSQQDGKANRRIQAFCDKCHPEFLACNNKQRNI